MPRTHTQDTWALPGGFVDEGEGLGEGLEKAAGRELEEETSVKPESVSMTQARRLPSVTQLPLAYALEKHLDGCTVTFHRLCAGGRLRRPRPRPPRLDYHSRVRCARALDQPGRQGCGK